MGEGWSRLRRDPSVNVALIGREHRELLGDAVFVMKPSRSAWGSRQVCPGVWTHDVPPGNGDRMLGACLLPCMIS
jgi:hypothetical protein